MTTLVGAFDSYPAYWNAMTISLQRSETIAPWRDLYDSLEAYYLSNGLYEVLNNIVARKTYLQPDGTTKPEDMRPIYNPATRVVEFYADLLWPGTLPKALQIVTNNTSIVEPIQQVWKWSNWEIEKDVCARWYAQFGSMFLKIQTNTDNTRVYFQNLKPRFITDMDLDERGYIIWVRIDLPQTMRNDEGILETMQRTEVWEKDRYRVWEHKRTPETPLTMLGAPKVDRPLTDFGINFVPIVYQPFRNNGDERGIGAFTLYLDKLDEIARMATRLHQLLFNYEEPIFATLRTSVGADNRPLPPIQLGNKQATGESKVDMASGMFLNLPGATDIKPLTPDIPYDQALAILNNQLVQIERDMPELVYSRIQEQSDLSGVAIRYLLNGAINKLQAARGNAEAALIRAQQMALTIGQNVGLFSGLGDFESGAFDHEFAKRGVLDVPEFEQAQTLQAYNSAGVPVEVAVKRLGWSEQEIEDLTEVKDNAIRRQQDMLNQQMESSPNLRLQGQGGGQRNGQQRIGNNNN